MDAKTTKIYTGWLVGVFALQLKQHSHQFLLQVRRAFRSYQSARLSLVCALAGHLEGNIVGSVALDLEGSYFKSGCFRATRELYEPALR